MDQINLGPGGQFSNLNNVTIPNIISSGIQLALIVAAIIFFLMLIIGGIRWMLSGGDKGQAEAARGQVTAAMIGLVIVFAAWAIAQLLATFFGITITGDLKVPTFYEGNSSAPADQGGAASNRGDTGLNN